MTASNMTAGILAGGRGQRLGGIDKGWFELDGRPLIVHTLARVRSQACAVHINANQNIARYQALGYPVSVDARPTAHLGPLAGVLVLLGAIDTPYLLIVPVDTPALPTDLGARLHAAMTADVDVVVACSPNGRQPLHCLLRRRLRGRLAEDIAQGARRVGAWQDTLVTRCVDWPTDEPFANINTPTDAARALSFPTRL